MELNRGPVRDVPCSWVQIQMFVFMFVGRGFQVPFVSRFTLQFVVTGSISSSSRIAVCRCWMFQVVKFRFVMLQFEFSDGFKVHEGSSSCCY